MGTIPKQSMAELVEELRSTGYHGRAPSIYNAPPRIGTCATAMRQLEVMASHIASAWLDGGMNDGEFWQFVRASFVPDVLALTSIIESTIPSMHVGPADPRISQVGETFDERQHSPSSYAAWRGTKLLVQQISAGSLEPAETGNLVVSFMIATMLLRRVAEQEIFPSDAVFHCWSSNIKGAFFKRCIIALGGCPFGAREGMPLSELEKHFEELARDIPAQASNAAREQIA